MKLPFLILTIYFLSAFAVKAQVSISKLDVKTLPKEIKYEGRIRSAISWKDKDGSHILITSETGVHVNKKFKHIEDGRDAELFAYHFLMKDETPTQIWKIYDLVQDCVLDLMASFTNDVPRVTDLNHDGIAEVWLVYKRGCFGDVSPREMKLIMYEGTKKYALRGEEKLIMDKTYGGSYKFDEAFTQGPKEFLKFAKQLWDSNATVKIQMGH